MAFGKKKNKQTAVQVSNIAEKYGIRISKPNGYYPEDVDKILLSLEDQITSLTTENRKLGKDLDQARNDLNTLQAELMNQRINHFQQYTLPEKDLEEDMRDISKISQITGIEAAPVDIEDNDDPLQTVTVVEPAKTKESQSALLETGELDIIEI